MKVLTAECKALYLKHKFPTTAKQVAQYERENPPENWAPLPDSLQDPIKILERGEINIRMRDYLKECRK